MNKNAVVVVLAAGMLLAACSRSIADSETTTTLRPLVTTTSRATTTTVSEEPTTLPPLSGTGELPDYTVAARRPLPGAGDEVVVLLAEPAGLLTDLDLYDVVVDVVERFPPVTVLHVVDDPAVVALAGADPSGLDTEQLALVEAHYLARLEDGYRIVYLGPFADAGTAVLGS